MLEQAFCSTPAGWTERDYTGHVEGTAPTMSYIYGCHDLDTANCRLQFHWPRNSTGGPTWARFPRPGAAATAEPSLDMDMLFQRNSQGDFSWGVSTLSIGEAGVGTAENTFPRIGVQFTGDEDVTTLGRAYRAAFWNTAGTAFTTAWRFMQFTNGTFGTTDVCNYHAYISGSTGYMVLTLPNNTTVTETVALTGSFLGTYPRWESYYAGGGGAGTNNGDTHPTGTPKAAYGYIYTVRLPGLQRRPVIGRVGFR